MVTNQATFTIMHCAADERVMSQRESCASAVTSSTPPECDLAIKSTMMGDITHSHGDVV